MHRKSATFMIRIHNSAHILEEFRVLQGLLTGFLMRSLRFSRGIIANQNLFFFSIFIQTRHFVFSRICMKEKRMKYTHCTFIIIVVPILVRNEIFSILLILRIQMPYIYFNYVLSIFDQLSTLVRRFTKQSIYQVSILLKFAYQLSTLSLM